MELRFSIPIRIQIKNEDVEEEEQKETNSGALGEASFTSTTSREGVVVETRDYNNYRMVHNNKKRERERDKRVSGSQ